MFLGLHLNKSRGSFYQRGDIQPSVFISVGKHGWDPRYAPLMYPFFLAAGPAFKQGLRNAEPFHIVDIYPLMCHILGLEPAPNNGSLSKTVHILSSPPVQNVTSPPELPPKPSNYSGSKFVHACSVLQLEMRRRRGPVLTFSLPVSLCHIRVMITFVFVIVKHN